jgi:hypothetical protein
MFRFPSTLSSRVLPLAARGRAAFSSPVLAASPVAPSRAASTTASGGSSTLGSLAYQLVFKRNVAYVSFIFFGAIVVDAMFGSVMKGAWRSMNYGRTFGALLCCWG